MSISNPNKNLGEFEQLILLAILRVNNKSHGSQIADTIEQYGNRNTNFGALYTVLSRLEQKGLVVSEVGEATAKRGGRSKKYFKVTGAGEIAVKQSVNTILNMSKGLNLLLDKTVSIQ